MNKTLKTHNLKQPSIIRANCKKAARKRNHSKLERLFPIKFLTLYFQESPAAADELYQKVRAAIAKGTAKPELIAITRKIAKSEKRLVELGLGKLGDRVTYWYTEEKRFHKTTGKPLKSKELPTNTEPYSVAYYLNQLDELYKSIIGNIEEAK